MSSYDDAIEALSDFIDVELEASSGDIKGTKALVKKIVRKSYEISTLKYYEEDKK